ncbi:hypothetical protein DW058_02885 [Clostridiaceae bacterium AF42-6]|nr:hypothetical protein DW058_02885 [Clostridiaceae bacterium AF42-6]RHP52186.1 hypothetical protein DWZ37_04805 [Clostridiaceae bacterium AF31-3BH]RHQ24916.1 hypothetical protein DWZ08_07120 [Clostridiaceae bacterium AF29-16BH]RHR45176.1 hypothetical protein DWX14_05760 [Clostridiaceae bacterium AF18-31LB]RHT83939.1 hypothetical protein DW725_04130 [Clostridiaceae bacterium AM27-36LB]RHW04996.1 hypothetical protein DXA90_02915 [Clostridiaceae bacterium OF09-1]
MLSKIKFPQIGNTIDCAIQKGVCRLEIKEITGDNFQTEVTKAAQPVLLEFYADGCSFCKAQLSVLEEAAEEACDVKFVRVNGDKERTLAGQFGVTVLPTMLIMNGEQIFRRITGYQSLEAILSYLEM